MRIRRSAYPLCLAASLLLLGPWLHPATAQLLGPEFQVNSSTTDFQRSPAVAADSSGNFVVVWESWYQDGSFPGVFGQRYDSAGLPAGSEFQVNSYTTRFQMAPAVAADGSGNFVVVWESWDLDLSHTGVFGQRYDSAGGAVGNEFQVNSYTTGPHYGPAAAADSSGNFVAVWQGEYKDGSALGVFGQRYDSAGLPAGSEFQVNSYTTGFQTAPALAADGSGNFVVVWQSWYQDGSGAGVFGQRYDSAGSPLGTEFQVNSYTTDSQRFPAVAADGSGNFVVAWESYNPDGYGTGVFGQRFNSSGSPVGSEFQVNGYTTQYQSYPAVTADGSGNFVVAWSSYSQDGSGWGTFGQRFNSAGTKVGREFQVNSHTISQQYLPAVAADGSGNFVVAWQSRYQDGSYWGVFGQRLSNWIFIEGFEAGDACAWSAAVGGGCP